MHKTDFHYEYDTQFLILEKGMKFIVDDFPAASKWEQNISFTKLRGKGKHQGQNKDHLFQRWLFKIIEFRLVSPFKYYVLKADFCGFCMLALSFQLLYSF